MNTLLGENWRDFLPPEGVDPDAVDRFLRDWKVRHNTVVDGNKAHLVVGDSDWQLPIPVIKTASGWQFDIKEGAEEILTREIGRNELAAIEALHAYVDAQQSYFALNQKYAQKIVSSAGKKTAYTGRPRPAKPPAHSVRPSARKNPALAITATAFASCRIKTVLPWWHGQSATAPDGRDELCNKPDRQGVPVGPRQRVREESAGVTCLSPRSHLATGRPITQAKNASGGGVSQS